MQGGSESRRQPGSTSLAQPPIIRASIDDNAVGRLRVGYARDLIIEAVHPDTPGGKKKENAVYVVNPTGSPDSRLVVDLLLVHK